MTENYNYLFLSLFSHSLRNYYLFISAYLILNSFMFNEIYNILSLNVNKFNSSNYPLYSDGFKAIKIVLEYL